MLTSNLKYNWNIADLKAIYNLPFPELIFQAQTIHRENFDPNEVQRSTLLSIKTGGCTENCKYCPQSAHYETSVKAKGLLDTDEILAAARKAKEDGSTRFCMGAAWREVREGKHFEQILGVVKEVSSSGLEVCCTLGMLTSEQAERLKDAGCHAYNHNLDTSPEFYKEIITTRTYEDRLNTLKNVRSAGMTVCCGGILGMGEALDDRLGLLRELANQNPHPESVPINLLVKVEGTPLEKEGDVDPIDFVRTVATARIIMPKSYVRLSAGRLSMTEELQALCFVSGANSIFAGEKLLTTPNPDVEEDVSLLKKLGMKFKTLEDSETGSCSVKAGCNDQADLTVN